MKELKPIVSRDTWSRELERRLAAIFNKIIYSDIEQILKSDLKENAAEDSELIKAIKRGQIMYKDGMFRGKITSAISKELRALGANFVVSEKGWRLVITKMSPALKQLIESRAKADLNLSAKIKNAITEIPRRLSEYVQGLDFGKEARKTDEFVSEKFRETVTKKIGVEVKLPKDLQEKLRMEYNQDILKSIVDFTEDETEKLRDVVAEAVKAGMPREDLRERLVSRFVISKERAKFIARQETSLFTTKLKQMQYEKAGIEKYRWHVVGDNRTRPEHKKLNNKVFDINTPGLEAKNADCGNDCFPGQDFNCRCQMVPIVERII